MTIDEQNMKRLLKEALLELFEERPELFYELYVEVVEDVGLLQVIKEGEDTEELHWDTQRFFAELHRDS